MGQTSEIWALAQRAKEFPGRLRSVRGARLGSTQEVVKDDSDRLSGLRRELRKRLGDERFELWLGAQAELALEGGVLRIRCSSQTELQWLRRRLHATLLECGEAVLGCGLEVVYESAAAGLTPAGDVTSPAGANALSSTKTAPPCSLKPTKSNGSNGRPSKSSRWTFADFVIGPSNAHANQAARETAMQPGRFTPLVLYGPPGSGKSHLLSAIGLQTRAASARLRTVHLTSEQFTTQFLEALDRRTLPSFRHKMRNLDAILIDDVQFFDKKKATLEELLYTIDALQERRGQVVLTCDRPPADLQGVSADLASRISAGLAVALELPDFATRIGIVRGMAHRMKIPLAEEVVGMVAQQVVGSGRLLSGAINRLVAASMALAKPITVELAGAALADFCRQHLPKVRLVDIQRAVCEVFGVESASLKSSRKTRAVAEPRMLAMWLARRYTRAALSEIGDFFGGRSHSTVVSAQRKFDGLVSRRQNIVVDGQPCAVEEAIRRIEAAMRTA